MRLRKSRSPYYIFLFVTALPVALVMILIGEIISVVAFGLYLLLSLWWSLFYYSLEYSADMNTVCIKNGVFLKKIRHIPVCNILWTMRLKMPFCRGASVCVLHTSGGAAVIFADFSTEC